MGTWRNFSGEGDLTAAADNREHGCTYPVALPSFRGPWPVGKGSLQSSPSRTKGQLLSETGPLLSYHVLYNIVGFHLSCGLALGDSILQRALDSILMWGWMTADPGWTPK